MYKKYLFEKGKWKTTDFRYVYSSRYKDTPQFTQENDCIVNQKGDRSEWDFEYISLVTEEKYTSGVLLETNCSFEGYGAPILVLSDDIEKDEAGDWRYGRHFEVVVYEDGLNVWRLETVDGKFVPFSLLQNHFKVEADTVHQLTLRILKNRIEVTLGDDAAFEMDVDFLPEEFHVGITACEGINRFYDFAITQA